MKNVDRTIDIKPNILLDKKINKKGKNINESDLKESRSPRHENIKKIKKKKADERIYGNNSYDKYFYKFPIKTERKENLRNKEKSNNKYEISPNKNINLISTNSPKYSYNNNLNSYTKIAINKILISPTHKNHITNIQKNNLNKNIFIKSKDKTANSSNSKIFKKLNEISPSKDENLNNTTEIDNDDEFNDEGINTNKKASKINKNMTRLKRAEIFLFDNGEDNNIDKYNIKVMKK